MKEHLKQYAFKPGQSGNPEGRPPTGRQLALACLERWLLTHGEEYMEALGKEALAKPIRFGRDILVPLFPKEMLITSKDGEGRVAIWRGLLEVGMSEKTDEVMQAVPAIEADCKEVTDVSNP
jgi:hypothetical protein